MKIDLTDKQEKTIASALTLLSLGAIVVTLSIVFVLISKFFLFLRECVFSRSP